MKTCNTRRCQEYKQSIPYIKLIFVYMYSLNMRTHVRMNMCAYGFLFLCVCTVSCIDIYAKKSKRIWSTQCITEQQQPKTWNICWLLKPFRSNQNRLLKRAIQFTKTHPHCTEKSLVFTRWGITYPFPAHSISHRDEGENCKPLENNEGL